VEDDCGSREAWIGAHRAANVVPAHVRQIHIQ
jgi:hypothetical protein